MGSFTETRQKDCVASQSEEAKGKGGGDEREKKTINEGRGDANICQVLHERQGLKEENTFHSGIARSLAHRDPAPHPTENARPRGQGTDIRRFLLPKPTVLRGDFKSVGKRIACIARSQMAHGLQCSMQQNAYIADPSNLAQLLPQGPRQEKQACHN